MVTELSDIKIIKKSSKDYPEILKEISGPPKQLYIRGNLPKNHDLNFAIVGTRAASEYGKMLAFNISKELAELGFNIISGMALGIDAQAHLGALAAKGPACRQVGATIAVLGSGISDSSIYPRENLKLAHKIITSGGAVISEYNPDEKSEIWYFPERNRIVSGLSRGVLVVEAPEKSGALITARLALEQNRDVFAVPGSIFSKNYAGTNYLIKNGARLVAGVDDILEELDLTKLKTKKIENVKQELTEEEKIILNAIEREPSDVDKICEVTKVPVNKILSIISVLEIQDIIKNIGGKFTAIK